MTGYSVILPIGGEDPRRYAALAKTAEYFKTFLPGCEVVVVELQLPLQASGLHQETFQYVDQHRIVQQPRGPWFNKALCLNRGAMIASGEYFILQDSDVLLAHISPGGYMDDLAATTPLFFNCRRVRYLSADFQFESVSVRQILGSYQDYPFREHFLLYDKVAYAGGSLTVNRDLFFEAGGADETWDMHYSGEDVDLTARLAHVCRTRHGVAPGRIEALSGIHLPHEVGTGAQKRMVPRDRLMGILKDPGKRLLDVKSMNFLGIRD